LSGYTQALDLPPGYIGRVLNNAANQWQHYSFTFTPSVSGNQYVMLAFRQDPAYWYVDNVSVHPNGNNTNMLTNGSFTTGGNLQVQSSNYGTLYISAPTAWGVSYQNGVYPSAAGTWYGGQWVDGAVGSYDGIYQGISVTAGTTYTVEFDVMGNHTATTTTTGWQLAVYAGACGNTGLATSCTLPSNAGFATVVAPTDTYSTGCGNNCPPPPAPAGPYQVSTSNGTITTTSTSGTITYTYSQPVIITLWSDNTTTTTNNGNPTLISTVNTGPFNASPSKVTSVNNFVTRPTNDSKVYINQVGDYNLIQVDQSGTKNNFVNYHGYGNDNQISVLQSSTSPTATNYTDIQVGGVLSSSNNTINVQQTSLGGAKGAFINVQDNNNSITLKQQDSGNHWAEVSVSGGNKTVDITQTGTAGHMASVQLTGPQPASLSLQQSGSTQQFYSIQSNCTTTGGCAPITVQQGR